MAIRHYGQCATLLGILSKLGDCSSAYHLSVFFVAVCCCSSGSEASALLRKEATSYDILLVEVRLLSMRVCTEARPRMGARASRVVIDLEPGEGLP